MRTSKLIGSAAALAVLSFAFLPSVSSSGTGLATAGSYAPVCLPAAAVGVANCDAIQLLNPAVNWHGSHVPVISAGKGNGKGPGGGGGGGGGSSTPSGYQPADLQSAYNLATASANNGSGMTVAIVDAYNDPNALQDVNVYRSEWGIPQLNSSTTPAVFSQVNGDGGSSLPRNNSSWSEEISLDLDMVSAICPKCNIMLVEANSASLVDLGTAVNYAANNGASVISNSYGASEFNGETTYDKYYKHLGIPITVSAGDSGYGVEYPAASQYVTAVGGTTLKGSPTTPWSQTVWSGTGSGCSQYEPNPGWQPSISGVCSNRTVADTSAVADPYTGVAVYDSFHEPGWMVFGGTSVASPIIASVYALAGPGTWSSTSVPASYLYGPSLNEVTQGSNGSCGNYLCDATHSLTFLNNGIFYNGPTGVGTPNGLTGF